MYPIATTYGIIAVVLLPFLGVMYWLVLPQLKIKSRSDTTLDKFFLDAVKSYDVEELKNIMREIHYYAAKVSYPSRIEIQVVSTLFYITGKIDGLEKDLTDSKESSKV